MFRTFQRITVVRRVITVVAVGMLGLLTAAGPASAQSPGSSVAYAASATHGTVLTQTLPTQTIKAGDQRTLSGRLLSATGQQMTGSVSVWAQSHSANCWKLVASAVPVRNGSYAFTFTPTGFSDYQVRFAGQGTYSPSASRVTYLRAVRQLPLLETIYPQYGDPVTRAARLTDSAGKPAGGIQVQFAQDDFRPGLGSSVFKVVATDTTDAKGFYRVATGPTQLSTLLNVRYRIGCDTPVDHRVYISWVRMFDTVSYSLAANGDLTVNGTGPAALVGGRIAAVFVNTGGIFRSTKQTHVGADGKLQWTFHLGDLPSYNVQLVLPSSHGRTDSREPPVDVPAGA